MGKRRAREIWEYDSMAEFEADGGAAGYGSGQILIGGQIYFSDGMSIDAVGGVSDSKKPQLPDILIKSILNKIYPPNPYPVIGGGEITHPCVVYSAAKFGGFFYWMAYTPYPSGNSDYENPVICASNDLISWVAPGVNPVVQKPIGGYNADTSLAFSPDGNALYLMFRERTSGTNYLKLMHTTDGVQWTAPVAIKTGTTAAGQDFASPSFWYNNVLTKWECIYHNLDSATNPKPVQKITSATDDPYGAWNAPAALTITPTAGNFFWHSHFVRLNSGAIVGLITENVIGGGGSSGVTFIASSVDFVNFSVKAVNFPLKTYRPSLFVDADSGHRILISNNAWNYFVLCELFERQEYVDYISNNVEKLNGTQFTLARDTFTRADSALSIGNSDGGTPWAILSGIAGISANRAYNVAAGNARAVINSITPDVELSIKLDAPAGSGSYIVLRALDGSNYIRYGVQNGSTQSMSLQTIETGAVVLNKSYLLVINYAEKPVFKIRAKGNLLQLFLNDCLFAEETLETFKSNTRHGFQLSGTDGFIDNFLMIPID